MHDRRLLAANLAVVLLLPLSLVACSGGAEGTVPSSGSQRATAVEESLVAPSPLPPLKSPTPVASLESPSAETRQREDPDSVDSFDAEVGEVVDPGSSADVACTPGYDPCLPPSSDYDCEGGEGNGPSYTGPVEVTGEDVYELDRDGDGVGCNG